MRNLPTTRDQVDLVERELTGQAVTSSLLYLAGVSALFGLLFPTLVPVAAGGSSIVVQLVGTGVLVFLAMVVFLTIFLRFRRAIDVANRALDRSDATEAGLRITRSGLGFAVRIVEIESQAHEGKRREYAMVCPAQSSIRAVDAMSGLVEGLLVRDPATGKPAAVLLPGEQSGPGRLLVVCPIRDTEAAMHMTGRAGTLALLVIPAVILVGSLTIPASARVGKLPLGLVLGMLLTTIAIAVMQGWQVRRLKAADSALITDKESNG